MKRFIISLIAVFFPWLAFLIYDNPGAAFVAVLLQCSIIGWLPASIWAWRTVQNEFRKQKRHKKYAAK